MIFFDFLNAGGHAIPIVCPTNASTLPDISQNYSLIRDEIDVRLLQFGAVLFRGFDFDTPKKLARFVLASSNGFFGYQNGNSPRTPITEGVYTATEYPAEYSISLHNELSYSSKWPRRIYFNCIHPAASGGVACIADSRRILRDMDEAIISEFSQRGGIRYYRTLPNHTGLGKSWQKTFETDDREQVRSFCVQAGISSTWLPDGSLHVVENRGFLTEHEHTGEQVWFNQVDQFHSSALPEDLRNAPEYRGRQEFLPHYVAFGDGAPIPTSIIERIKDVINNNIMLFPWKACDLLLLDNVLVAHGRVPFTGHRKLIVSLAN